MNILKRELRVGLKAFIFWMIGLFLLSFIGIIKYEGYTSSGSMTQLLESFPRVVLAVMGAVGVDMSTISGYTAMLSYYILICAVIYGVHIGAASVSRESIDKTYEFVFTKPCSRTRILGLKLLSAYIYLFLFCVFSGVFSMMAVDYLKTSVKINHQIFLFSLSVFLVGALFVALSAFLSSIAKNPEKGTLLGNLAFLYAFILGVVYNMLEKPGLLKLISPFNYFSLPDLVAEKLDPIFTTVTLIITVGLLYFTFTKFNRKDLL